MGTAPEVTVAILGTGAMGRFWAYRLGALNPLMVGHVPPPYVVRDAGHVYRIHPRFASWSTQPGVPPDVVLLATKWRQMPTALQWITQHAPTSLVVSLMNGMGQEEALAHLPVQLAIGTTTVAVTRVDTATEYGISVRSQGETLLPGLPTALPILTMIADRLVDVPEMLMLRWIKLIQNSIINPISAIANRPNGCLPQEPLWALAAPLLKEGATVASQVGLTLPDDLMDRVIALTVATQDNLSSMLQDVRDGLSTEIQAINGYVVRQGRSVHVPTPTHTLMVEFIQRLTNG